MWFAMFASKTCFIVAQAQLYFDLMFDLCMAACVGTLMPAPLLADLRRKVDSASGHPNETVIFLNLLFLFVKFVLSS